MYNRYVNPNGTYTPFAWERYESVEECYQDFVSTERGYTLPDFYLPYFLCSHRKNHVEITKTQTLETTIIKKPDIIRACEVIWQKERGVQLSLF